ncbi:MAG: IS982 family transposase [Cyanobacteria bacterium P01_A01_bin.123]
MINEIMALYCIVDDLLKAIGHVEDSRRQISDAEVITTGLVVARFFGGNHRQSRDYLDEHGLIPQMLSPSRLNRRLHAVAELIYNLQQQFGQLWMHLNDQVEYLLDSFPVAVCDNIRIAQSRRLQGEHYRGYIASKKRYFYGIRIHLISPHDGIPVEWVFLPGAANDVRGLQTLPLNLPAGSELYTDKGYTDYRVEDNLAEADEILLMSCRKRNSKRPDSPCLAYIKQTTRYYIETVFSQITRRFPKVIHAVTFEGFLLKVSLFI